MNNCAGCQNVLHGGASSKRSRGRDAWKVKGVNQTGEGGRKGGARDDTVEKKGEGKALSDVKHKIQIAKEQLVAQGSDQGGASTFGKRRANKCA